MKLLVILETVICCGFLVHQHVLQNSLKAIDIISNGYAQAGAYFPDFGYQCRSLHAVSELAHWPPFLAQAVWYSQQLPNQRRSNFQSFIYGVLSHSVSDLSWHSLHDHVGLIRAVAQADFNGSYGKGHGAADLGGEFLLAHSVDIDYHVKWMWPTQDLVEVFRQLGHSVPADDIDYCMRLGQLYTAGVKMVARKSWYIGAYQSPYLTANFDSYFHGGLRDMTSWTKVCLEDVRSWFTQNLTHPDQYEFERCKIENKFRWKTGLMPAANPRTLYQSVVRQQIRSQDQSQLVFMGSRCTTIDTKMQSTDGQSLVVGDFDGSNKLSVVVGEPNSQVSTGSIAVYNGQLQPKFRIQGQQPLGKFGHTLAVFDHNLDGFDDLAVSVPGHGQLDLSFFGQVQIYYGGLGGLQQQPNIVIDSKTIEFGHVLHGGDVNGDGYADLIIGSPFETDLQRGSVAVHCGNHTKNFVSPFNQDFEQFGASIATAGNMMFIGAPGHQNENGSVGAVYVYKNLTLVSTIRGSKVNARFGSSISASLNWLVVSEPSYSKLQTGKVNLYSLPSLQLSDSIVYHQPFALFGSKVQLIDDVLYVNTLKDSDERGKLIKFQIVSGKLHRVACHQGQPRQHFAQDFLVHQNKIYTPSHFFNRF